MPARFCAAPGCPELHHGPGGYCPAHRVRRRPGTVARGYGAEHKALRQQLLAQWKPGDLCAHCRQPMHDPDDLDLAHTDDRTAYRGLAHAACNRGDR